MQKDPESADGIQSLLPSRTSSEGALDSMSIDKYNGREDRSHDDDLEKASLLKTEAQARKNETMVFMAMAIGSIATALGFSYLQEQVFRTPDFKFGGWMTFLTYLTYALCGWLEAAITGNLTRHAAMKDFFIVSVLAMGGAYFTNWALNYLNYTTRIVFKSCRVLPVMAFRSLVVGAKYTMSQYMAGAILVVGIALFTSGDAEGLPNFSWAGVALISIALVCDAMTANLEEKQFFRIKVPCTHAEVMLYLSAFAAVESFVVIYMTGELQAGLEHSKIHTQVVPSICAFSVMGYVTVCLVLLIIKGFGATNAEIVKSMRKVCQVLLSFWAFPKAVSYKHILGGVCVGIALYWLQKGKRQGNENEAAALANGIKHTNQTHKSSGGPSRD